MYYGGSASQNTLKTDLKILRYVPSGVNLAQFGPKSYIPVPDVLHSIYKAGAQIWLTVDQIGTKNDNFLKINFKNTFSGTAKIY